MAVYHPGKAGLNGSGGGCNRDCSTSLDKGEPSANLYGPWMAALGSPGEPVHSSRSKSSWVVLGSHGGGSTNNRPPSPPQAAMSDEPLHGASWFAPLEQDHLADIRASMIPQIMELM